MTTESVRGACSVCDPRTQVWSLPAHARRRPRGAARTAARGGRRAGWPSSGVATWDGSCFAHAWGTEWVETKDVGQYTVFADQPMTRAMQRPAEAGDRPGGDDGGCDRTAGASGSGGPRPNSPTRCRRGTPVLSLTTVEGTHALPSLVDLRSPVS
ncbi:hypothetical protein ACRAWF_16990 [Streptomyces sp. L7]